MKAVLSVVCVVGILMCVGAVGWWALHRGEVVESRALFDYSQARIAGVEVGSGGEKGLGEPLGPYELRPADNLVTVRATFSASRDFQGRVPDFRLVLEATDSKGRVVWKQERWIRRSRKQKKAKKALTQRTRSLALPALAVPKPDRYTFRADAERDFKLWLRGHGRTGRAALTLTIRKHVSPFPWLWVGLGLGLVALGAVLSAVLRKGAEEAAA
jgi:hypothetical protein